MSRSCTAFNSFPPATPPPAISDRMVDTEFEAAEVLASFSKSTPPPLSSKEASVGGYGGTGESVDSWESITKRASTVRVKTESSPVDSPLNSVSAPIVEEKKPVLLAFDLNEDQATTFNQEEECRPESKYVIKPAEPNPASKKTHTGAKSRQNLSEAEKEARRLRRVLANRESARQTIRRRQAQYEELTRKVADLARENENLKKEKESAFEDYQAVKSTNKKLNEQIAEQSGPKVDEHVLKSTSALPFTNYPYIVCPYNIHLPVMNPPHVSHNSERTKSECSEGNSSSHWCMVPYPLFIPMPDTKNTPNLIPLFPSGDRDTETMKQSIHVKTECPSPVDQKVKQGMEFKQERSVCHGKRKVDPAMAAEARKRRKELKKMKSLHCRGHRNNEGLRLGESRSRSRSRSRSLSRNS